MVMAENARTSFVWYTFMKNEEARRGMERALFKTDSLTPSSQAGSCSVDGCSDEGKE
jgi:hypothetical protein